MAIAEIIEHKLNTSPAFARAYYKSKIEHIRDRLTIAAEVADTSDPHLANVLKTIAGEAEKIRQSLSE